MLPILGSTFHVPSQAPGNVNLATCFDTEEDADVLLLLSTDMQPCSNRHDVESEAEHVQQHTAAEAPLPITSRTYRLHAVVLKSASAYFKACLTASWQQQPHRKRWRDDSGAAQATTADSSTDASCSFRYQVTETVEAWQLAAMDLLLRLLYGQQVPQDASSELLLQVLALADRYQAFDSASTVLDHMAWSNKHISSPGLLQHVGGVPAAIQALPVFQLLMVQCHSAAASILKGTDTSDQGDQVVAARQFVISRYRDVPAVIKSPSLKAQFCNLPFAAVVAWARSDELRVHSENCVVHLLSTWLQAQPTEPSDDDSMDEDERDQQAAALSRLQCRRASLLAEQVRVLHLGRCYQHLALPSAKWFHESNSCKTHLPMLLAAQGVCKGRRVIPAPVWGPDGRAYSARELFAWCGPDRWLEAPRTACGASDSERVFDWLLTTAEVEALLMRTPINSPRHYLNGFQLEVQLWAWEQPPEGVGLGMVCVTGFDDFDGPTGFVVALGPCMFEILGSSSEHRCCHRVDSVQLLDHEGYECTDLLEIAPTLPELLAPWLQDGMLHIRATFSFVDSF